MCQSFVAYAYSVPYGTNRHRRSGWTDSPDINVFQVAQAGEIRHVGASSGDSITSATQRAGAASDSLGKTTLHSYSRNQKVTSSAKGPNLFLKEQLAQSEASGDAMYQSRRLRTALNRRRATQYSVSHL